MADIRLVAYDHDLSIGTRPKLASGNKNTVYLSVGFDDHWEGYQKSAVFFTSSDKKVYEVLLDNGKCAVPHEVLVFSGYLYVGIRGVTPDTQKVKTSDLVKLRIDKGAPPPGDATSRGPTPDVYQQILAKLNEVEGLDNIKETVAQAVADHMEKLKPVTSVNGKEADTNGSVALKISDIEGGEQLQQAVADLDTTLPDMIENYVEEYINEALGGDY